MVRYSPTQVVPNTPGVWLGFIAWNLWSEDYQDFDDAAAADDDDNDFDDNEYTYMLMMSIKEIWSRCETCFS